MNKRTKNRKDSLYKKYIKLFWGVLPMDIVIPRYINLLHIKDVAPLLQDCKLFNELIKSQETNTNGNASLQG